MSTGWKWLAWLLFAAVGTFLGIEIPAILDPARGDTLSEHLALIWPQATAFLTWFWYHIVLEMAKPGTVRRRLAVLPWWLSAAWGVTSGVALVVSAAIVWV